VFLMLIRAFAVSPETGLDEPGYVGTEPSANDCVADSTVDLYVAGLELEYRRLLDRSGGLQEKPAFPRESRMLQPERSVDVPQVGLEQFPVQRTHVAAIHHSPSAFA